MFSLAETGQQQVVASNQVPLLSQPGLATHTVYSLSSSQPTLTQPQYTAQQLAVVGQQLGQVSTGHSHCM